MIFRAVPEGAGRLIEAHRHVLDAIGRRDAEGAALWMRRHAEDFRKGFVRTGKDFDRPVERLYLDHLVEAGDGASEDGEG
ncbi:FCD domain-containing protein [Arenibaculum sp.]|jgi:DNA-binding GntR family transcriptional regulator|uniref:FCD domain-containing protein n=1 Tax=Arenibaculum sp. TaxID=2865862 RepID=UPI002E1368FE|nr:FCD domain-containing protein [Arenibaculum sp.]